MTDTPCKSSVDRKNQPLRKPLAEKTSRRLRSGLRMVAVDQVNRRTTTMLPIVALGKVRSGLRERGVHQLSLSEFTLTIDEPLIFDGEAFAPGRYRVSQGPSLQFVTPARSST